MKKVIRYCFAALIAVPVALILVVFAISIFLVTYTAEFDDAIDSRDK